MRARAKVRQILFIQGAGKDVHTDWDAKLVDSLRHELGPRYDVRYPRMPNEDDPTFSVWRAALEQELDALEDGAVVVGHSVGGAILVNALAERTPNVTLGAIVLIAAPFMGAGGWTSEDIEPRSDLAARLPPNVPIVFYHGDKDDVVPIAHVDLYARSIPHARVRRLGGRDHQLNNDLSDVARDIRELDSPASGPRRAMARMVVIYRTPADPGAFDAHYMDVHVPLAKQLVGLRRYEISRRPIVSPAGDPEPHLIATLYFDDLAAISRAFATPAGQACAADRRVLAPNDDDVQMYLFDTVDVQLPPNG